MTMAKGLTSSYLPLGAVAMRHQIAEKFDSTMFYGGLTYSSHPVSLAAALATIRVYEEDDLIENAARLGPVMRAHHERLYAKHPSVGAHRNIGLFGILDLVRSRDPFTPLTPFNGTSDEMKAIGKFFRQHGLYTMIANNSIHTNPPLSITEEQLAEGFEMIDARPRHRRPGGPRLAGRVVTTGVPPAVELEGLRKVFGTPPDDVVALDGIDLRIEAGEFVSIIGPSGCGKSTLLRVIGDLTRRRGGTVLVNGKPAGRARLDRDYGMVFQAPVLMDWRTIARNVELPLEIMGYPAAERAGPVGQAARPGRAARRRASATRGSSRVACSSGWRSPGPSPSTRSSCSWTSRSARSTR